VAHSLLFLRTESGQWKKPTRLQIAEAVFCWSGGVMNRVSSVVIAISLVLGSLVIPKTAPACSGSHCGGVSESETHGYYKKSVYRKTVVTKRSCSTCVVKPPCNRCSLYRYRPFYRGYGTRFTGGPLQFRWGQPIRNALRVPARMGVRAASLVGAVGRGLGRLFFPRRFY